MKTPKGHLIIFILVTLFIFMIKNPIVIHGESQAPDWPGWRGPNGKGISNETNWDPNALAGGPNILWRVDLGRGYANVAIKDNRLYTMGLKDRKPTVFCFNAENGRENWRFSTDSFGDPQSTPAIDGKYVYALNNVGTLLCLKSKNGRVHWQKDLVREYKTEKIPYGYSGSPVIVDELIILNVNTSGIALNKNTGDLVWASPVHTGKKNSQGYHATPVIYSNDGKKHALFLSGTGLSSVEAATGKKEWYYEFFSSLSANVADPEIFQNMVLLRNSYIIKRSEVIDISGNEPHVLWQNKNMRNDLSTCVQLDGYIYGSDGDYYGGGEYFKNLFLRCIDFKTGEVIWEEGKMKSNLSLTAAGNKLIILEENGTLHIAEATPSSYREISSCDVLGGEEKFRKFWTPPVLCNGRIYARNYYGDLICIDVRKKI
jgi:outer membrane protein assembly factor BamB